MRKLTVYVALIVMAFSATSCYDFNRRQNELDAESNGRATLLEAESSKKAKIEEAKADFESSKLKAEQRKIDAKSKAEAQVIKANADAEAIKIINNAIKSNPEYLKYKMIESIRYGKTVYIPTEASLPIIERR